jgi:hypothetical protein
VAVHPRLPWSLCHGGLPLGRASRLRYAAIDEPAMGISLSTCPRDASWASGPVALSSSRASGSVVEAWGIGAPLATAVDAGVPRHVWRRHRGHGIRARQALLPSPRFAQGAVQREVLI